MNYIKTKNGQILETKNLTKIENEDTTRGFYINKNNILYEAVDEADTIPELCNAFYVKIQYDISFQPKRMFNNYKEALKCLNEIQKSLTYTKAYIEAFIRTDKGFILVATGEEKFFLTS